MKKFVAAVLILATVAVGFAGNVVEVNAGEEAILKKVKVAKNTETLTSQSLGMMDNYDSINQLLTVSEVEMPYYVGKEKKSFLKDKKYDKVLYLGTPYYLPELNKKAVYFSSSDESVAVIKGNELVGKKQGLVTVTAYNSKKEALGKTVFAVTTYNDGKDVIKARSFEHKGNTWEWYNTKTPEYWKTAVNTIQDMCFYLQARNFVYDFAKEPEFISAGRWQWTAEPETIFAMSGGVCVQVAQMGNYMLANKYEDWGNIIVSGNQGHIFNWFYEDGYYYIMDFTEVISDNAWNNDGSGKFRDYTKSIRKFKSIKEIKKWITSEKVDTKQNFLVCMYSCQGHDYMPAWYDEGCADTRAVTNGTNKETAYYGFQDIVYDEMTILFQRDDLNIGTKSFSIDEMPCEIMYGGIYGYKVEQKYYFDYK